MALIKRFWHRRSQWSGAALVVMLAALSVPALLWVPEWLVNQYSALGGSLSKFEYVQMIDRYRLTLAQGLGGVIGIYGLWLFYRRTTATEKALAVSQQTLEVSQYTLEVTRESQITERFAKAMELLGSASIDVRLGGIYSLERIARDSPRDHWTIMEVLSAYVRRNAPAPPETEGEVPGDAEGPVLPRTDIQAILTVLGRRERGEPREKQGQWINLSHSDLRGLSLRESHLEGALLFGAHLENAELAEAHLEGAMLSGTHLDSSYLRAVRLDSAFLRAATLADAFLLEAHLEHASGLTVAQVKAAKNWETAHYSPEFRAELGLSPEEATQ